MLGSTVPFFTCGSVVVKINTLWPFASSAFFKVKTDVATPLTCGKYVSVKRPIFIMPPIIETIIKQVARHAIV
jgi:hypothetical protein